MYLCYFVYGICVCVYNACKTERWIERGRKLIFQPLYPYPMERCFETANFKLISLGKGRTRINFFLNHVSISPRLSNVFKSAESSFRNRKQTKRKKKIHPRTDASHPHHFYTRTQYPYYSKCPAAIPLPLLPSSFSFSLPKHGLLPSMKRQWSNEGKEIKRLTRSSPGRERLRGEERESESLYASEGNWNL